MMQRTPLSVLACLIASGSLAACRCGGGDPAAPGEGSDEAVAAQPIEGSAAPADGPCDGRFPDAVALVDCSPVMSREELGAALADTVERYERLPGREPTTAAWRNERRRRLVRAAVQETILARHVAQAGIEVGDASVEERLRADLEHVYDDARLFERFLASRGTTREAYFEEVRAELALDALLEERARTQCAGDPDQEPGCRLEPTDEDVQAFYEQNRERWREGERVRASNITIRLRANADDEAVQEARQRITAIRDRIVGGEDFADVARAESESADRVRGGDRGWIVRGRRQQLVEDGVEDVLFRTQVGTITEPIRTQLGFQIFKVFDRRPEGFRELDEVREILYEPLRRRNRDRLSRELENELIQQTNVVYVEDNWGLEDEAGDPAPSPGDGSAAPSP